VLTVSKGDLEKLKFTLTPTFEAKAWEVENAAKTAVTAGPPY
jgi:hypothetical protein